jgi:hypothetical protein
MTIDLYDKVRRDFDAMFRKQEAENGICSDEDVCLEDREPPVLVGMFEPIPMPLDPYGCENPVSQEDAE